MHKLLSSTMNLCKAVVNDCYIGKTPGGARVVFAPAWWNETKVERVGVFLRVVTPW